MGNEHKRWITLTENVDVDTGEILSNTRVKADYYKTKQTKKYEENEKYRIVKYTNEYKKTGQGKLF